MDLVGFYRMVLDGSFRKDFRNYGKKRTKRMENLILSRSSSLGPLGRGGDSD